MIPTCPFSAYNQGFHPSKECWKAPKLTQQFFGIFNKNIFKLNLVWSNQKLTDLIDTSQERLKALETNFISHFWYFL